MEPPLLLGSFSSLACLADIALPRSGHQPGSFVSFSMKNR